MTITINVPDEVAAQVSSLSEAERRRLDETLENLVVEAVDAYTEYDEETSQEIVAAGLQAIQDIEAGRLLTIEQMDARFAQDFADARLRIRAQISSTSHPSASRS